jgi:hypothetical protein
LQNPHAKTYLEPRVRAKRSTACTLIRPPPP